MKRQWLGGGAALLALCALVATAAAQTPPLTREGLVGRWQVVTINSAPPMAGSMLLELAADGQSFMEMGGRRDPAGGWELVVTGPTLYLRQINLDGSYHDNVLTVLGPDQFQLDDMEGNILLFLREVTVPSLVFQAGPADPLLEGSYVLPPTWTGGGDLVAGARYVLQPAGVLQVSIDGTVTAGRWGTIAGSVTPMLQLEVGGSVFEAAWVRDPDGNLSLLTAQSVFYFLSRE